MSSDVYHMSSDVYHALRRGGSGGSSINCSSIAISNAYGSGYDFNTYTWSNPEAEKRWLMSVNQKRNTSREVQIEYVAKCE